MTFKTKQNKTVFTTDNSIGEGIYKSLDQIYSTQLLGLESRQKLSFGKHYQNWETCVAYLV